METTASGKQKRENLMSVYSNKALLICMKLIGKQSLLLLFALACNAPVNFPSVSAAFLLLSAVQSVVA